MISSLIKRTRAKASPKGVAELCQKTRPSKENCRWCSARVRGGEEKRSGHKNEGFIKRRKGGESNQSRVRAGRAPRAHSRSRYIFSETLGLSYPKPFDGTRLFVPVPGAAPARDRAEPASLEIYKSLKVIGRQGKFNEGPARLRAPVPFADQSRSPAIFAHTTGAGLGKAGGAGLPLASQLTRHFVLP